MFATLIIAVIFFVLLVIITNDQNKKINSLLDRLNRMEGEVWQGRSAEERTPTPANSPTDKAVTPTAYTKPPVATPLKSVPKPPIPARAIAQEIPRENTPKIKDSQGGKQNLENWVGKNVIGLAASVLVFIGLIFFGIHIYEYLTEFLKFIIMYSVSILLSAAGMFLVIRRKNAFTLTLTGCGAGSLFISILLSHIYFDYISDITAFALITVWIGAVLYAAYRTNSLMMSVVAHVGMVFSICFAFDMGINDEKLAIVLIYQALSTAVLLVGNILCFKKTYRFGLLISQILSVVALFMMYGRFLGGYSETILFPRTEIPASGLICAFALQILGISFISYLLAVSCNRLKNQGVMVCVHIFNKLLWIVPISVSLYRIIFMLLEFYENSLNDYFIALISSAVCCSLYLVHTLISVTLKNRLDFKGILVTTSNLIIAISAAILFLILYIIGIILNEGFLLLSWLIIIAAVLIVAGRLKKNRSYIMAGNILLGFDWFFMLVHGYKELDGFGTIALPACYTLVYLFAIWGQWAVCTKDTRRGGSQIMRIISLIFSEISMIAIVYCSEIKYQYYILLISLVVLNIILYLTNYDRSENVKNITILKLLLWINESIVVLLSILCIANNAQYDEYGIVKFVLTILTFILIFTRVHYVVKGLPFRFSDVFLGIKFSGAVIATVFSYTEWFDKTYVFSLICMGTALVAVIGGFFLRAGALRIYGLVTTLVCVLKLVTFDISELNSLLRVVCFIGGGIICFIISALYNYSVKMLNNTVTKTEIE